MTNRLPIFHDDFSFHDRQNRVFEDMKRQMGSGFGGLSAHSPFDDQFGRFHGDFYQLRPRDPMSRVRRSDDVGGSRESLDENSTKSLFIEDPQTKSRRFQISFDVKEYNPTEVSVKMQDDSQTLLVEAKNEKEQEGNKLINEFSRKLKIPKEVDPEKLSSTLSTDGVLTISAPVPPNYQSIADGSNTKSIQGTAFSPNKATNDLNPFGRSSPAMLSPQGRNSPSFPQQPQHSPTINVKPFGRNSLSVSSPQGRNSPSFPVGSSLQQTIGQQSSTTAASPSATPMFKKQIYMVPSTVKGNIISSQQPADPNQQTHEEHSYENGGAPVTVRNMAVNQQQRCKTPPLDTPTFYNTDRGCEMMLLMNIGEPYTPDDLLVKVDGYTLTVEAEHVEMRNGRKSKSSISREFELNEHVDPTTVTALLKEGKLKISGLAKK